MPKSLFPAKRVQQHRKAQQPSHSMKDGVQEDSSKQQLLVCGVFKKAVPLQRGYAIGEPTKRQVASSEHYVSVACTVVEIEPLSTNCARKSHSQPGFDRYAIKAIGMDHIAIGTVGVE